jgi:Peptidase family M48
MFPMPQTNDHVLNFYAGEIGGAATVVLPLQSLKLVEDLTTAFAWLYVNKSSLGTLDLYFAMLQRKPMSFFGPAGKRDLLTAIGAPENVLSDKRGDKLSLSLRNEAFAFILVHELGHLLFKHKGLAGITPAQARADEVQSDAFALNVLARTGTPPLGTVLFFQTQIFSLPHRGEYKTAREWQTYLQTASTHPLSVDRIRAMAQIISGPLADQRTTERAIWQDIGTKLDAVATILADVDLHNCMTRVAAKAPIALLRTPRMTKPAAIIQFCRSLPE